MVENATANVFQDPAGKKKAPRLVHTHDKQFEKGCGREVLIRSNNLAIGGDEMVVRGAESDAFEIDGRGW